jgi:SAM-dependent methyltransferase
MKYLNTPSVSGALRLHRKAGDESKALTQAVLPLIKQRDFIVDVGAGDGALTYSLSEGRKVIAIEPSPYNLPMLRRALTGADMRIIPNKIEDVELPVGCVDAILFTHSLYYVANLPGVIQKVLGWLRPRGVLVFVLLSRKGDQSDIIARYWERYHKRELNMLSYSNCVRGILSKSKLTLQSKEVVSYCSIREASQQANFVSIALDIPFLKLLPSTRAGIRDLLSRRRRPYYRRYRASTVHEILTYRDTRPCNGVPTPFGPHDAV